MHAPARSLPAIPPPGWGEDGSGLPGGSEGWKGHPHPHPQFKSVPPPSPLPCPRMTSMPEDPANAELHLDALIVGAGPTGLALAAQLHRFGARFRIVDRLRSRMRESRALGVQARSLEILDALGLARELISRGSP